MAGNGIALLRNNMPNTPYKANKPNGANRANETNRANNSIKRDTGLR